MSKPVLIFRADANNQMGTGHLMRSAALAGILSNDFYCKLLTTCNNPALLEKIQSNFPEVHVIDSYTNDTDLFLSSADESKLAVLDGYPFGKAYQQNLQHKGFHLAIIDDLVTQPITADLIINHCGGIIPTDHSANADAVFALGTSYLLLNPVFLFSQEERRTSVKDKNCFICLGGADPENITFQVLRDVCKKNVFENIHVVAGAAFLHIDELRNFSEDKKNVEIYQSLSSEEMKHLMLQCSFAICSPSTIVFEYLSIGGIVWLQQIADNQKYVHRFLTREKIAFDLTKDPIDTSKNFPQIFEQQAKYFDGRSNERLQRLFGGWIFSKQLTIRKANEQDLVTTYNWANDAEVRNQSYSSDPISLNSHTQWFTGKLNDRNCFYYILSLEEIPVAQIRFDIKDDNATLSYLADVQLRNKGMGAWILSLGINQLLKETNVDTIVGHVKKTNISSVRSFEKLAFTKTENSAYPHSFTYTMRVNGN